MRKFCQRFIAPATRAGNPRRVWVLYRFDEDDAHPRVVKVEDEGYQGRPESMIGVPELPTVHVPAGEYNKILSKWGSGD